MDSNFKKRKLTKVSFKELFQDFIKIAMIWTLASKTSTANSLINSLLLEKKFWHRQYDKFFLFRTPFVSCFKTFKVKKKYEISKE